MVILTTMRFNEPNHYTFQMHNLKTITTVPDRFYIFSHFIAYSTVNFCRVQKTDKRISLAYKR